MRYFVILFFSILLYSAPACAQNYRKHTVQKGETVTEIAKKYKVTPYDIYRLNPDSKNGISENAVLLIPATGTATATADKDEPSKVANTVHEVQPKETLYSLSKKYNVSVDDIKKANPATANDSLQVGQKVIIPIKGSSVAQQVKKAEKAEAKNSPAVFYHTVKAGETKYSIAKDYGVTVQLIEELNPAVKETLPLGYELKLYKNGNAVKEAPAVEEPQYVLYTVAPKETFYSIGRKTGLTEQQIVALNPEAKDGLKEGMELKLPQGTAVNQAAVAAAGDTNLIKTLKKTEKKELALLLPFNLNRIEGNTDKSTQEMLKTDKFLNMTLDFYAGALMAIDSAEVLGLPLRVKIFDAKETKSSSDVKSLSGSLGSANAVIGPFFPGNVEVTAAMLGSKNIPVISPLSKEATKPYANLYQSVPTEEAVRMAMMDYLKSKNGNVVAVIDSKKTSSRQFIKDNYPGAKLTGSSGSVDALKPLLVSGKMNYVILDSESKALVASTTKALATLQEQFQIQLVVLEITDALENDEVPAARLAGLKMLYPSVTKDEETPEGLAFARAFKAKNGAMPNQFARRGFDVTFDTILRLFQEEGIAGTMHTKASEQVENKFAYIAEKGGNYNTAVYILQYDEGFNVKQAQ